MVCCCVVWCGVVKSLTCITSALRMSCDVCPCYIYTYIRTYIHILQRMCEAPCDVNRSPSRKQTLNECEALCKTRTFAFDLIATLCIIRFAHVLERRSLSRATKGSIINLHFYDKTKLSVHYSLYQTFYNDCYIDFNTVAKSRCQTRDTSKKQL